MIGLIFIYFFYRGFLIIKLWYYQSLIRTFFILIYCIVFQERGKALGYIAVNRNITKSALSILDDGKEEEKDDRTNELHIKIIRCNNLRPTRENHQPSPYCVYKWHNSIDYDTEIIPASNHPEFNDHNVIGVSMSWQLDDFLKTKVCLLNINKFTLQLKCIYI